MIAISDFGAFRRIETTVSGLHRPRASARLTNPIAWVQRGIAAPNSHDHGEARSETLAVLFPYLAAVAETCQDESLRHGKRPATPLYFKLMALPTIGKADRHVSRMNRKFYTDNWYGDCVLCSIIRRVGK